MRFFSLYLYKHEKYLCIFEIKGKLIIFNLVSQKYDQNIEKSTNPYSIKLKASLHVTYCKVLGFGLVWISLVWFLRQVLFT